MVCSYLQTHNEFHNNPVTTRKRETTTSVNVMTHQTNWSATNKLNVGLRGDSSFTDYELAAKAQDLYLHSV